MRIAGLDILRSLAIIQVVLGHSSVLMDNDFSFPCIPFFDGVELFFVLSGFLVGKIILENFSKENKLKLIVFDFLQRRWFRTIPNYFLFLFINILLVYFGITKGELNKYAFSYFVFFQNFHVPFDLMFWESWSLSVEEWFYLLFPILITIVGLLFKREIKQHFLIALLLFLILPLIIRVQLSTGDYNWDLYFRKLVVCRLDSIGYGLLFAWLLQYKTDIINKYRVVLAILGFIILTYLYIIPFQEELTFFKTFYFSVNSLAMAMLLPLAFNINNQNIAFKPFTFISKISYSMYLLHIPLMNLLLHSFKPNSYFGYTTRYTLCWTLIFSLSYLIYKYFEKPVMNWRERVSEWLTYH